MTHALYREYMPDIFYELLKKGLSQRLCAVKLGVAASTLNGWVTHAEEHQKESPYYKMWCMKELAKADRAVKLMESLEKAAERRAPEQIRWMLNKCDAEEYDLPENSSKNGKKDDSEQNLPQLSDAEVVELTAKFMGLKNK